MEMDIEKGDATFQGILANHKEAERKLVPNWLIEVLAWIKRLEMADSALSTSCWTFQQLCWPKLHGNIEPHTIPHMTITTDNNKWQPQGPPIAICTRFENEDLSFNDFVQIATVPPPAEYTDKLGFEKISLHYLNDQIVDFFKCTNSLLKTIIVRFDTKIIDWHEEDARILMMRQVLSTFAGKVAALSSPIPGQFAHFHRLFPGLIEQAHFIVLGEPIRADFKLALEWLKTETLHEGKRKTLLLKGGNFRVEAEFVKKVKQEFLKSTEPRIFQIVLAFDGHSEFIKHNEQTGELLFLTPIPVRGKIFHFLRNGWPGPSPPAAAALETLINFCHLEFEPYLMPKQGNIVQQKKKYK